ncbi:MAG: putative ABC-type ATPase [Akkermansiaceae bacterium]
MKQGESFVLETVFADPVGDKLAFLKDAAERGYTVVLCFIGISGPEISDERVAMRILQGGHDVPPDKLISRYPRILANLQSAIRDLPHVLIFDNDDLRSPFRKVTVFDHGKQDASQKPMPTWLRRSL